ncbi:FAD-binding oxidoreductase [Leifsonia xyli]|uniref:FAD-binding oxidoreductase n=1 Tax=Leifsonia xyli TaxID=1575 RepID=UPI003D67166F
MSLADPVRVGEVVREPRPQELTPRERAAGPRRGRILSVASPAQGAKSLEIADYSGHLRTTEPGQHLRLHRIESGAPLWRNYTVSAVSDTSSRITVDLREDGEFSPWVHRLAPGDEVVISGPFGSVSGSRG